MQIKQYGTPSTAKSRQRAYAASSRPSRLASKGYDRTSGYYGRFSTPGGENKFFDTTVGVATIGTGGTIFSSSLNLIPQGTTESSRIGRKCTVRSLSINGSFFLPGTVTAADGSDVFRLIIYLDKQCNGAAATVTDILETANIYSFNNLANSGRFRILKTKKVSMSATAGNGTSSMEKQQFFSFTLNLNLPLEFSSTTGALTEIRSNNLGVLAISQDGKCQMAFTTRIRFSDN